MRPEELLPIVRHLLQFFGGLLVAKGWADADTANELVASSTVLCGALLSVGSILWYRIAKPAASARAEPPHE